MFTTNNNNFLIKSQFSKISSTVRSLSKELKFNIVFNLFLAITFLNIFFSKNTETKNFIFLLFASFFIYNLISNLKEFRNIRFFKKDIEIIFNNKLIINMIASPEATNNIFITDKKNIEIINNTLENKIISVEPIKVQDEISNIINPNLKERTLKKRKQLEESNKIKGSFKNKEKIFDCMNFVSVRENGSITTNYCKNRYCPFCDYIKTIRYKILIEKILKKFENNTLIFLTLTTKTIKVISSDEIKNHRKKISTAFSNLMSKKIAANQNGYIRKIETNYNSNKNECNIHIHSIVLMKNYKKNYIKKSDWLEMWKQVLKDDSIKELDIKIIKNIDEDIKKISNYITKQQLEKMLHSDNISNIFAEAEYRTKDYSFAKEFKIAKQEIEKNTKQEKEINKIISNTLLNLKWSDEKNLYIN